MGDDTLSLLILGVVVVLFVWNRLPVEIVAIGSSILLLFSGILELGDVLAGYGDPAVVMIAALFVVSEGLDASGVTTWIGQALLKRAGSSARRLVLLTMLLTAGLTALIGINGAVAALLPMAVVVSLRRHYPTSRLLMPLAFAGSAGGVLLLTGSPVNVVVSAAAEDAGLGPFRLAEFAFAGVPLVIGTVLVVVILGPRLLPDRVSTSIPPDLSRQAQVIVSHYGLDNVFHLRVPTSSDLLGVLRGRWGLESYPGIKIVTVLDGPSNRPVSDGVVGVGDRLSVVGDEDMACRYAEDHDLVVEAVRTTDDVVRALLTREIGVLEVVVPPRSRLLGEEVSPGSVVLGGRLVILSVDRQGKDRGSGATILQTGDTMLLEGDWDALDELSAARDVLVVDSPDLVRRQAVPLGRRAVPALVIVGAMILMLATGIVPPSIAALLAAGAMVVCRVVTVQQAYRGISWTTVLLVAGMMPMSTAITTSGAGASVAGILLDAIGNAGPTALLVALFVVTIVFGQLISNTATALVMIPIALSAAAQMDISARPVLMSVCVAAAAAFLTPIATPANMMVMGPGGYRFGDYWKLGLPLIGVFFLVAVFLVPIVWHF